MEQAFVACKQQMEQENSVCLVGIMEVQGSSPRHKGSFMAVGEDGILAGTIGGGKLEYDAMETAKACLHTGRNQVSVINMTDMSEMICGGQATLLFTVIGPKNQAGFCSLYESMEQAYARKEDFYLAFSLEDLPRFLTAKEQEGNLVHEKQDSRYVCYFPSARQVFLFGAGHVISALVPLLLSLDFPCTVLDDRGELLQEVAKNPCNIQKIEYKQLETKDILAGDYVVIATRGHEWDLEVVRKVLRTPAHYIGVMGSRRKVAILQEVLSKEGFSEQDINRIITPIGLPIGSETPEEIAVSIAAQLIQDRRGVRR